MSGKKGKILMVIPYFIPAWSYGGPVKVAYEHALGLISLGWKVTVVTTDALDKNGRVEAKQEILEGIEIVRFRNISNHLAKFHNIYLPIGMFSWLRKNIGSFSVVHIHDIMNIPSLYAISLAKKYNVKYFAQPHGTLSPVSISSRKSGIKAIFLSVLKKNLTKANGIFALNIKEKNEIEKVLPGGKIHIIPNGIRANEYQDIEKIDLHKKFDVSESTVFFTFLGRLQYIKGIDRTLRMLGEYNKNNKNRRFLIIGPDEGEKEKLLKLAKTMEIEKNIIRYGMSTGVEKHALLSSSDIFLFSSRSEGFGLVILESILNGTPVVISNECPLPQVIEYDCGESIDADNIFQFISAIERIMLKKCKLNNENIKRIAKHFDYRHIVEKLEKLYL